METTLPAHLPPNVRAALEEAKARLAALYGETEPELAASLPQGDEVCVRSF